MGKVKNQHYVPQSYLKNFTDGNGHIHVYDKETNQSFQSNIKKIAAENYFYDFSINEVFDVLKSEGMKDSIKEIDNMLNKLSDDEREVLFDQPVEHFFSNFVEGNYKRLLDKIRTRAVMSPNLFSAEILTIDEMHQLSYMLALQVVRSKEYRESHFEAQQQIQQAVFDILAKEKDKDFKPGQYIVRRSYENKALEHAGVIFGELPFNLASIFQKHIWFVGVNKTKLPFYTSDHPVVKRGHKQDPLYGTDGYGSEGIEIAIPISSKLVLVMVEPKYHSYVANWHLKFIPLLDEENIIYYNSLQVNQSYRQVYCIRDEFSLIKQMKGKKGTLKRVPKPMLVNAFGKRRVY